tara:strand:- start:4583 stop:5494 length:912 start_codon:yes stop_codon:yes gene_type:complete
LFKLLIHGGAGAVRRDHYSNQEISEYKKSLKEVLDFGVEQLAHEQSAEDVVVKVVSLLEDNPLFNSGRGSVLTSDGRVQMDAAVMCGQDGSCGAVTLAESIKNPVQMAQWVMRKTPHRLLGGRDVDLLAKAQGFQMEDVDYFVTEKRREQLAAAKAKGAIQLDHDSEDHSQTVGAVALDVFGNVAAATSTGGLTNKMPGRVSDSAIVGAGTFADNQSLAFSATGTGDVFIQNMSGFDAHALMVYSKKSLSEACDEVLEKVKVRGGRGGVIALRANGESYMAFNSLGMFRGQMDSEMKWEVAIF